MAIRTRCWQALLMLCLSLTFLLVVLEIAARSYSWHLGKGFWNRPHSFESAFFVTYDWPPPLIDGELGTFRAGQTVAKAKRPDELRVISLGGSTTVNARNRDGRTYSRELQTALRQRLGVSDLFVLNAGGDAFSSAHSLTNLSLRLLDFEPDVITVLHNINDLTAREFGDSLEPDYSNKYLDDAFLGYEHRGGVGGLIMRFSRGAQMVKWRMTVLRRTLERSSRGPGVGNPEDGPQLFERNLRSIVALARAHGVRPILLTQAHRSPERQAERGEFIRYNNVIRQLGADLGAPVVDLGAALSGRRELFLDKVHFNGQGVRAIAAELEASVSAELEAAVADRNVPDPELSTVSTPLSTRWQDLLDRAGLDDPNLATLRELKELYSEKHRTYHNFRHIADCLDQLDGPIPEVADLSEDERVALGFAFFFHDAIYSTVKGGNEQKSADLARDRLTALGASPELVGAVDRLIMATTHDAKPESADEALMIDIDLSILGRDRAAYEVYEHAIRKEYRLVPGPLFRSKRKEILQRFLEQPRLFHTESFHRRFDAAARDNLRWAISRL
ncbi:MAG: GDSL-type esterase/lipase family protein [Acidobacteriota bacterium]